MRNNTAIVIALGIILGAGYFVQTGFFSNSSSRNGDQKKEVKNTTTDGEENSVMKDGIQYVAITARGGYSPRQSFAKAGVPTKLVMKTNGTYDCSSSLVIHSLSYRKTLPNTGETIVDISTPKTGDVLQGVCSMGMYSFVIHFK
jgi:plastocyanin domain-containing protein